MVSKETFLDHYRIAGTYTAIQTYFGGGELFVAFLNDKNIFAGGAIEVRLRLDGDLASADTLRVVF